MLGPSVRIVAELPGWLSQLAEQDETPDMVLMHLGTNNFWHGQVLPPPTRDDYTTIVGQLRAANLDVTIIVAQIIPNLYSETTEHCACELNAAIPAWADSTNTPRSPVYVVDLETGFDPAFLAEDAMHCHPNEAGAQWMADTVCSLLAALL